MGTETAGELLSAGAEALLEAAFRTGGYDDAEAMLRAARVRAGADGDRAVEAAAIDRLGWLMHFQALDHRLRQMDPDGEEALFQQALAISREIGDLGGVAAALFGIGLVRQVLLQDWDTAMPHFREALALADAHGDDITRSEVHRHIGFFYLVSDVQVDKACEHLRISLDLRESLGDPRWIPSGTSALGEAELAAGRHAEGLRYLRAAVRQAREAGLRPHRIEHAEEALREAEETLATAGRPDGR
jgi:tetratricopeptide (TPR) repeat protein